MPTLDADSLLSDPAPIWFDEPALGEASSAAPLDPLQAALATLEAQAQRPLLAVVPPPAADPLAQALPWLVRHLGVAAAVEAVVGPVDDDQPAASDDVLPALRRIGFDAHLQRRSLASFTKADLPTVLMLHSGDACVLTARWQDAQGQAQCNLVLPGPQPDEFSTAEAEIEAEYSGVALVVSRPARPPFASALARARAASAGRAGTSPVAAGPAAAADAAPMAHADALVALAAAVQGAQRAMHATHAEASPARPMAAAAAAAAQPLPARAAPPLAAQAPARLHDDEPAALLNLSFMQPDKAVVTPGQALARMAHDARALVRVTVAPVRHHAVAAARALVQLATAAGRHLAGLASLAKSLATGVLRVGRQAAHGPGQRAWQRWRLASFQARQLGRHWRQRLRQRQLHRQALAALGPSGRPAAPVAPAPMTTAPAIPSLQASLAGSVVPLPDEAGPLASPCQSAVAPRPAIGTAAQRLAGAVAQHALAWLPGLAGASALCLLVGAPQAWAGMVSSTSLQALQATPGLLRGAFTANLDEAGQALAAQGLARLVAAKNRMDCELGQPMLAPLAGPGLLAELARPAAGRQPTREREARGAASAAGQGGAAGPSASAAHAVRGRGLPRRARHACR